MDLSSENILSDEELSAVNGGAFWNRKGRTIGYFSYTIQPGDNIYVIAQRSGIRMKELAEINSRQNLATLKAGDTILLPDRF